MSRLVRIALASLVVAALSTPLSAAGLLAPDDRTLPPLRVTDHLVDVSIRDRLAFTSVSQTFQNDTGRRLEATYVFPLPEEADLTGFEMTFNGKMVPGRVLPAEEAAQIYESIVRQSRDPGLIEFIGRRLLQMRVFPIEPNSPTTIQVRYQQVCRPISGMLGYHYPLRTRKTAGQAYGTVRFSVRLESGAPLKTIWSPTHAVDVARDGENAARVGYEASRGSLEDDFILLYDTDSSDLGLSLVAHQPDAAQPGHFVLMMTPSQLWPQQSVLPQDVVLVLDTSGSMAGEKLEQAKAALKFCVDKLNQRDRFSVVRFSTGFDVLHEQLQPVSKERRDAAKAWIDGFSAAGGTNIADTLAHVMAMRPTLMTVEPGPVGTTEGIEIPSRRPYVVVFLTDGQGNRTPAEIMTALGRARGEDAAPVRLFPFGVGHDVNTLLLDGLAERYTGHPIYVQPGENLELVMSDFFSIVSQPVLTDLQLTLPEVGVTERFPATLGDLYHGQQIIIAGRFATALAGDVRLTAIRDGEPVEFVWKKVPFTHTEETAYVPTVWAGRKIAFLIDQIRRHGESSEMVAEVVALSQRHGIQTPYTSWLVDPERDRRQFAAGRPWRQPASRNGPGSGGSGGSMSRGGSVQAPGASLHRESQLRAIDRLGVVAAGDEAAGAIDAAAANELLEAEVGVMLTEGRVATDIARANASLKQMTSRDGDRLATGQLLARRLGDRWYNLIGGFLVDADLDERTEITVVNFGSEAYFLLARRMPKLREALAASRNVAVITAPGKAILVAAGGGIERFSDEQLEQMGWAGD